MESLKRKRTESLVRATAKLMSRGVIDQSKFVLNAVFANKAIEHYMQNLDFLKKRYGIPDKANMLKIAGLMAYSIVKFKPLIPLNGREQNFRNFGVNEWLAIFYGLCACSDLGNGNANEEELSLIVTNSYFEEWFKNFKYLLEERNYTAESLIVIFETLGFILRNNYTTEA